MPTRIVFDNATGVGRKICGEIRTSKLFGEFAAHYGFEYSFCNAPAVWNSLVWPQASDLQKADIVSGATNVLDVRGNYPDASLATLYDPDKMPEFEQMHGDHIIPWSQGGHTTPDN